MLTGDLPHTEKGFYSFVLNAGSLLRVVTFGPGNFGLQIFNYRVWERHTFEVRFEYNLNVRLKYKSLSLFKLHSLDYNIRNTVFELQI